MEIQYLVAWSNEAGQIIERAEACREEVAAFLNTHHDRLRNVPGYTARMMVWSVADQVIVDPASAEMGELWDLATELAGGPL